MAVTATAAPLHASRRRLMFGANVALSILAALGVVMLCVYLAGRFWPAQWDWTTSGANSLSPRTVKLVRGLDQNVTVTALYTVLSKYDTLAVKRQRMVSDLLDLYEGAAGGKVASKVVDPMSDQGALTVVLERLKNKPAYKDESAPHRAALETLPALLTDLAALLKAELDTMVQIPKELQADKFGTVGRNFDVINSEAQYEGEKIQEILGGDVPQYGKAVDEAKAFIPRVQGLLSDARDWATQAAARRADLPPAALSFYQEAGNRYAPLLARCAKLLEDMKDLKQVELEKVYGELRECVRSPVILVETEKEARTLPMHQVWPNRGDPNAPLPEDGDTREFAGERAVSSAVLQLTQKEKTAVIFTHWGGQSPLQPDFMQMQRDFQRGRAPYQAVDEFLKESNFLTAAWDVKTVKQPPVVEGAVRRIYVVFRPTQPERNMMQMQQAEPPMGPADKKLILDAVNESGRALFTTGWSVPDQMQMMMGGAGADYEFNDYLKSDWGIDVKANFLTIAFMPKPDPRPGDPPLWIPRGRASLLQTLETPPQLVYGEHEIVAPLRTLSTALGQAAPLEIVHGDAAPKDVRVSPLLKVPPSGDVWAIANVAEVQRDFQSRQGTAPREADLRSGADGFPLALAAERTAGDKPGRVVVVSSENFAADDIAFQQGLVQAGNTLKLVNVNPGNLELFINSLHWLSGNVDRIAIGPTSGGVPRLSKLQEGAMASFCRVFLVGIWPGLMLAAGAGVWLFRRR